MGGGDGRVLQSALAQVIAVGIRGGGPVLGGADEALGLGDTVIAFDGVRGEVRAPCAFRQAGSALAQGVACCRRSRVVAACLPSGGGGPVFVRQVLCAATSLRAASARLCHRCRWSLIWTASGRARRTASA